MTDPKRVGIAVVEHEGQYLVGERPSGVPLAGYAEFPGGKCLADESPFVCAVRECFEESGLVVTPSRLLQHKEFEYPHGRVELHFVLCHPARIEDVRNFHKEFRWVAADMINQLKFPDANWDIIALLQQTPLMNCRVPRN